MSTIDHVIITNKEEPLIKDKEEPVVTDDEHHDDHHEEKKENEIHRNPTVDESKKKKTRDRRQRGKKAGSWKKLDVEVNFKKKETTPNKKGKNNQPKKNNENKTENTRRQSKNKAQRKKNNKKKQQPQYTETQYYIPTLSPSQLQIAKTEATKQIEYFFSDNELCRNTFLRQNMDVEGYLPAAMVFNFPSVVMYGVPYFDLMDYLKEFSEVLEVDVVNETMRVRVGWEKWLYPNGEGGFGCPRWIKQQEEQVVENEQVDVNNSIHPTPELVHCTDGSDTEDEHKEN